MSEPTNKTYRFRTFQELLDRVPADRIRGCLAELGKVLGVAKATAQLHAAVACDLAGVEFNPEDRVIELREDLEWIDDGKEELGGKMHLPNGDPLVDFKIVKKPQE